MNLLDKSGLTYFWGKLKAYFATKTELNAKQDTLTFDTTPTSGSTNPVTSGGVYDSIQSAVGNGVVIYDVEDDGSTTAGTWIGTSSEITSLYEGLTIRYKLAVAGASTTKLNVNDLGAKTVYRAGSTKLTTNYAVGSYIFLYYSSLNSGCWEVYSDYDANSYSYVRQYQAGSDAAGTAPKYPLLARYNVTNKNASYDTAYARYHTGATLDTSTGELEAASFVKTGGTSSQFLKADGSVDSSEYALASSIPSAVTESTVAGWGFTKNTGTYSKPSGGIPATDLASAVQTSLGKADTALQSYTETDPTVPSWAKAASKPTYTASEVGALPDTTTIPSKTSDLTNDSGFITGYTETDPVFSASAAAGITSSDIAAWNAKQNALTFDSTPTSGSTNPVTSGGVYDSILDSIPEQALNYTSGYLVKTSISTSANSNFYFRIEGKGHGTDNFAVFAFGSAYYISGGDFSYTNAYNLGTSSFGPISLFVYDGYIYLWFSQTAAYYRFWVTVYENSGKNRVDTITDAAKPSGALHNVDISPINNVKVSGAQTITGTKTFSAGTLIISTATSGSPALILQRGTASDGYVDHRIQSSSGALCFVRNDSGTNTLQMELGSTSLYPVGTLTDSISNLYLGNSTHYWAAIYSNIGDFKGDVAIGGDLSITGGVSINGTIAASNLPTYYTGSSAPSSSLGQDGDIYLQISS